METNTIEQKLERIEKLLISQKTVLNFEELVEYTGLSQSYLYKLTSKGDIPFYRPNGKQLYFNKVEIDAWLLRNRSKTNEEIQNGVTTNLTLKVIVQSYFQMVDFIVMVAPIEPFYAFNSFNPFEWNGLKFYPKFKKGILKGFESEYNDLRVFLYYDKIQLSNSLHKFYKGNNYSNFTHSELTKAIQDICQMFEIEAEYWEIKKMEFGFNISHAQAANENIALFLEYKKESLKK